jgi:hypothetical protein
MVEGFPVGVKRSGGHGEGDHRNRGNCRSAALTKRGATPFSRARERRMTTLAAGLSEFAPPPDMKPTRSQLFRSETSAREFT